MDSASIQAQIRANSLEVSDFLSDLNRWEKDIASKDRTIASKRDTARGARANVPAVRGGASSAPVPLATPSLPPPSTAKGANSGTAANHTYDKGYKKWENFDVDAALEAADKEEGAAGASAPSPPPAAVPGLPGVGIGNGNAVPVSPADFAMPFSSLEAAKATRVAAPAIQLNTKPRDEIERESGNEYFKKGEFYEAIKCYTRSIAVNRSSAVTYSNRAMAYLKTGDYLKAEDDASSALRLDSAHVKSFQRRATARNAQGKHKAALKDLEEACKLKPNDKLMAIDVRKTKELINNAIRRTPRGLIEVVEEGGEGAAAVPAPAAPSPSKASFTGGNSSASAGNSPVSSSSSAAGNRGSGGGEASAPAPLPKAEAPSSALPSLPTMNTSTATVAHTALPVERKESTVSDTAEAPLLPSSSPPSTLDIHSLRQAKEIQVVEKAKKAVEHLQAKLSATVPAVPKTSYEFDRVFSKIKDSSVRASFLTAATPAKLPLIFKTSLEPNTLKDVLVVQLPLLTLEFLEALATVKRIQMVLMLLDTKEGAVLESLVSTLTHNLGDGDSSIASRLAAVRAAFIR